MEALNSSYKNLFFLFWSYVAITVTFYNCSKTSLIPTKKKMSQVIAKLYQDEKIKKNFKLTGLQNLIAKEASGVT